MTEDKAIKVMIERLVSAARADVAVRQQNVPLAQIEAKLPGRAEYRPFRESLVRPGISIIAEYKRRSPSAGWIGQDVELSMQVKAYERGGAAATSILTDSAHFGGSVDDLQVAKAACDLPILRKDFIVDPYQVYEAALHGADAILLISRVLPKRDLERLLAEARALDLDCLVEVHSRRDLDAALDVGADVVGINSRDLRSQWINRELIYELLPGIPTGKTVVAESGLSSSSDIEELDRIGVDAVLMGEALMKAEDPEAAIQRLSLL